MLTPMPRRLVSSSALLLPVLGSPNHNLATLAIVAGLAACGGSGDDEEPGVPGQTVSCQEDARIDHYPGTDTDELDKAGELGVLSFRFFDLVPSPPAKGNNTFHVQLDSTGAGQSAGTDLMQSGLRVDLRMPDHGHGTSVEPVITPNGTPGGFMVAPLYLFMPGIWRLEFEAYDASTGQSSTPRSMIDRAALHFCIEG
jgi:hypothetical protein